MTAWQGAETMGLAQQIGLSSSADRAQRLSVEATSTLRMVDRRPITITVVNYSETGCQVLAEGNLADHSVVIGLAGAGSVSGRVVWSKDGRHGIAFDRRISADDMACAFTGTEVVSLRAEILPFSADEPVVEPYSYRTRVAVVLSLGAGAWLALGALLRVLL